MGFRSHLPLQVIAPRVKAYLYTWGEPRSTTESERIPVKIENLDIGYIDGMLLLPLVEEHTIDERSPLCGHTHQSLLDVRLDPHYSCAVNVPAKRFHWAALHLLTACRQRC